MSNRVSRQQKVTTHRRRADLAASGEATPARVTVLIAPEMDEALRIACVRHKMSMSHAVEKAIARYLSDLDIEEIEEETRNLPWVKKEPK